MTRHAPGGGVGAWREAAPADGRAAEEGAAGPVALRRAIGATAPLAVFGIWVVCAAALQGALGPRLAPNALDIVQYLALGALVPAIALVLAWFDRGAGRAPIAYGSRVALAALAVVAALWLLTPARLPLVVAVAAAQTGLLFLLARSSAVRFGAVEAAASGVAAFLGAAVASVAITGLVGSGDVPATLPSVVVGALALAACCWWAVGGRAEHRPRALVWLTDGVAGLVLIVAAFRTDGLFEGDVRQFHDIAMHHWGVFVGSAEMVRQGGWLLWDVPSQYGWLNILALAALPVASTWQAMYLFNGLLVALAAGFVYAVVGRVRPGFGGSLFALALALAVHYAFLGVNPVNPPHYYPSVGAFRFFWCYALLAALLWERTTEPGGAAQRRALIGGTLCWLAGTLWSAESAFYSAAIWLPGYVLAVSRDRAWGVLDVERGRFRWRVATGWVAFPVAAFAAALAAITAVYLAGIGRVPDFRAFFDYVLAFGGADMAATLGWGTIDIASIVLIPVFAFLTVVLVVVQIVRRDPRSRDLGVLIGAGWAIWATGSYVVSRKDASAARWVLPFVVVALALALRPRPRRPAAFATETLPHLVRGLAVPVLAVLLFALYASPDALRGHVEAIRDSQWIGQDVTRGLPVVDPALAALMEEAGVRPDDPIVYAGNRQGNLMPAWTSPTAGGPRRVTLTRTWLPTYPFTLVDVLPVERRDVYMQRMADRLRAGGWLIQRLEDGQIAPQDYGDTDPWFFAQALRSHVPTRALQDETWQAVWFDYAGDAEMPRPALPTGRLEPLSAALTVDGVAQQPTPNGVWAIFGAGWEVGSAAAGRVGVAGPATIWAYAPEPGEAEIGVGLRSSARVGDDPTIRVNGREIDRAARLNRGRLRIAVPLAAGWNEVEIDTGQSRG